MMRNLEVGCFQNWENPADHRIIKILSSFCSAVFGPSVISHHGNKVSEAFPDIQKRNVFVA